MKTKPKMTYEEHVQFGRMLKDMHLMLFKVCGEGGRTSSAARAAWSMEKKLGKLRNEFDSVLYRNYPNQADPGVYYGE